MIVLKVAEFLRLSKPVKEPLGFLLRFSGQFGMSHSFGMDQALLNHSIGPHPLHSFSESFRTIQASENALILRNREASFPDSFQE